MKRSKHVLGRLLALGLMAASTGQAAVQTFTDERDRGPSLPPAIISATLTDPYPDTKPIQHDGFADFSYWYTAGLNWRDSTAAIDDGFTARLAFAIDSDDLTHRAINVQTGFMIDRPVDITIPTVGQIDTTLRILDKQGKVVATYNVSDQASDRFTVGYSHVVEVPSVVGKHFTVEAQFHIAQQGQYQLFGDEFPAKDRYLFSGFSVTATPVPEAGAVAMVLGGLACVGFLSRPRRRKKRLLTAGLALTAGLIGAAQAQDAVIASATLNITGLGYRLVDLDPTDGISPTITFASDASIVAGVTDHSPADLIEQRYPGVFPAPFTFSPASSLAQVTRTDDGFTLHAELRRSDLDDPSRWPTRPYALITQRSARADLEGMFATTVTLSPHTQLILEGQLAPNLSVDMSSLANHPLIQDPAGPILSLHGRSVAYLGYAAFLVDASSAETEGSAHVALEQDVWRDTTGGLYKDSYMPSPLLISLSNNADTAKNGHIWWGVSIYTDVSAAVPEPETLGLALAGMLLVPAALRMKRAQKRQR